MESQLIECKKIEFIKAAPGQRPFTKEFAENLAIAIKHEGLLSPIVVRPNNEKPGFYLGVAGKHRLYAVMTVLKEQFIAAIVFPDMDAEDAEMARISENLWRIPLTKVQHIAFLKRWYELYVKQHGCQENGEAGRRAFHGKNAMHQKNGNQATGEPAAETKTAHAPAPVGFTAMAAAATGQSEESIRRDTRIAKVFDFEQLEVFEQLKVSKSHMQTIAKIKDKDRRAEVVALIGSGMEPEDALREVMKEAPTPVDGKSKETYKAEAVAKQEKQAELTDEEWFKTFCGEKAAMFGHPEKFKSDALLFRWVSDARHDFRVKNKKHVASAKAGGVTGALWYIVNRFISLSHPKDWFICEVCKGKGDDEARGGKCQRCYGGGYHLKTEIYL